MTGPLLLSVAVGVGYTVMLVDEFPFEDEGVTVHAMGFDEFPLESVTVTEPVSLVAVVTLLYVLVTLGPEPESLSGLPDQE